MSSRGWTGHTGCCDISGKVSKAKTQTDGGAPGSGVGKAVLVEMRRTYSEAALDAQQMAGDAWL